MSVQQLIDEIITLQGDEAALYVSLDTLTETAEPSELNNLVTSITAISSQKNDKMQLLQDALSSMDPSVLAENQQQELENQLAILQNVEGQLNTQQASIKRDKKFNVNNLRLTEINTYYSKQYTAKFKIFRMIAIMCLPILLIGILKQRYILSSNIANSLATLIVIIALFFIVPAIADLYMRDNMVYDQYKFPFNVTSKSNPAIDETIIASSDTTTQSNSGLVPECVGEECCTGPQPSYDSTAKKCVEGFTSGTISGQSTQSPGFLLNKTNSRNLVMLNPNGNFYATP